MYLSIECSVSLKIRKPDKWKTQEVVGPKEYVQQMNSTHVLKISSKDPTQELRDASGILSKMMEL